MNSRASVLARFFSLWLASMVVAGGASAATTEPATDLTWKFRVLLDDREIGYHDFRVSSDGTQRRVETEASFDVKILFLNAFSYRHRNVEVWQDDCLRDINAFTDSNGKELTVRGTSDDQRFVVTSGDQQRVLPSCVMSFAYWNPALLTADRLLNSQTGEFVDVAVTPRGRESVSVNGSQVAAQRYDLDVDGKVISVWYAAEDWRWLALEAPARGDRKLRYLPVAVPGGPVDVDAETLKRVAAIEQSSPDRDGG